MNMYEYTKKGLILPGSFLIHVLLGKYRCWLYGGILFLVVIFAPVNGVLCAQTEGEEPVGAQQEKAAEMPNLADIIPLASDLPGRLAQLKNNMKSVGDVSAVEKKYTYLDTRMQEFVEQLEAVRDSSGYYSWSRFVDLRQKLKDERGFLESLTKPLTREIRKVVAWETEWLAEKKNWDNWEKSLLADQESEQLDAAFLNAHTTIDTALGHILQKLEILLLVQAKVGKVKTRIDEIASETEAAIFAARNDYLFTGAPPIFSKDYASQFVPELWQATFGNLRMVSWPNLGFFTRHGWTFLAQLFFFIAVIIIIRRNRQQLNESERWQFLAGRPFSAAFFVVILTQLLFHKYLVYPNILKLIYTIAAGVSIVRLLRCVIKDPWKRQAAFSVVLFFVVTSVISVFSVPLPLYRLYILLVSLLALCFFWRWAGESLRIDDSILYAWFLRLGSFLMGVIVMAQLWGNEGLASYLFLSSLTTLAITLAFIFFLYMVRGGIHWVFFDTPVWQVKQLRNEAENLTRSVGNLIDTIILVFVLLPIILTTWGVYESVPAATTGLLAFGFNIGSQQINVGLLAGFAGILYFSYLLSWILPKVLLDEIVVGHSMERGARISIGHLIQYLIVFVGFLLAITALGFDFTKVTIVLSALGVGIGFGLQGIVNNFVSGLILLFEQPVRVGDTIEVGGSWTNIKKIGLRSTTLQTVEQADVIIPNADLINNQVTNWTLSNRQGRGMVQVGVAYGSDVPLVIETLMACAKENEMVSKSPAPEVLFRAFGESTLDFELRVWLLDVDNRLRASSDLYQEIDRRFREANIEIAFPQRDLHLRSIDSSVVLQPEKRD